MCVCVNVQNVSLGAYIVRTLTYSVPNLSGTSLLNIGILINIHFCYHKIIILRRTLANITPCTTKFSRAKNFANGLNFVL